MGSTIARHYQGIAMTHIVHTGKASNRRPQKPKPFDREPKRIAFDRPRHAEFSGVTR